MAYQNKFLFRSHLTETAAVAPVSYCSSPDIIAYKQITDPVSFFKQNYTVDPSMKVSQKTAYNYLYTRAKSITAADEQIKGYIRLYRASASLFMNTPLWSQNKLLTDQGDPYIEISAAKKDEISVGRSPFTIDGTKSNFCLVGIVNDSTTETLPDKFSSTNDFVLWVNQHKAVCVRNLSVENSGEKMDYEMLYGLENPGDDIFAGLRIVASGIPDGTKIGIQCDSLGINESYVYSAQEKPFSYPFVNPANFLGSVKLWAKLPSGNTWPVDALLELKYIAETTLPQLMSFSFAAGTVLDTVGVKKLQPTSRMVFVGACGIIFKQPVV